MFINYKGSGKIEIMSLSSRVLVVSCRYMCVPDGAHVCAIVETVSGQKVHAGSQFRDGGKHCCRPPAASRQMVMELDENVIIVIARNEIIVIDFFLEEVKIHYLGVTAKHGSVPGTN